MQNNTLPINHSTKILCTNFTCTLYKYSEETRCILYVKVDACTRRTQLDGGKHNAK